MSRATDKAYETIRGMILSGELPPGSQLGEEALAEACGVSRTPVRDALRRLESEMLVRRSESQRSFVADWSMDELLETFELRALLEARAASRAANRMSDEVLRALENANRRIGNAIRAEPPDVQGFLDSNREFHTRIVEVADSPRLAALLATLVEQPVVRRTAHHYGRDALRRSHAEHEELLAAFARRDGPWAASIMTGHIRRAYHAYADAHRGMAANDSLSQRPNQVS